MPVKINVVTQNSPYNYQRLKKVFRKSLNYTPEQYKKLSQAKNPVIGNIPDDILKFILQTTKDKTERSQKINAIKSVFARAAEFFRRDKRKPEAELDRYIKENNTEKVIDFIENLENIKQKDKKIKQKTFSERAGVLFQKNLAPYLPSDTNISIEWIDEGGFSDVFIMHFCDSRQKDLFSSKVFKIYKYYPELKLKALTALMKNEGKALYDYFKKTALTESSADVYAQAMLSMYKDEAAHALKSATEHGAAPEANSFYYVLKNNGQTLKNSDMLKFDLYDIKNAYSLSSFRSESAPNPAREVNLKSIGVVHTDKKPRNIINGVCIDMGGIELKQSALTDPVIRRIYKKLKALKNPELIEKYKKTLQNPKTPHREKIKQAIEIYSSESNTA